MLIYSILSFHNKLVHVFLFFKVISLREYLIKIFNAIMSYELDNNMRKYDSLSLQQNKKVHLLNL